MLMDMDAMTAEVRLSPEDYDGKDIKLIGVSGGIAGGVVLELSEVEAPNDVKEWAQRMKDVVESCPL